MTVAHATVLPSVDIPSDVVAAARKWHNVQRQRQEKKNKALYDSVVMRRKGPSRKDKCNYNKGYAKEQKRQNERKLLVQKWVWEEHVNHSRRCSKQRCVSTGTSETGSRWKNPAIFGF